MSITKDKFITHTVPLSELQEVFDNIPTPVSKDQPYFKGYAKDKVSKEIKKIFTSAGLDGYGAKSLRRFMGEEINSHSIC